MLFNDLLINLTLYLVPVVLAVGFHEFSHVAMARWLGDDTGTRMGRYTLNPLAHADPIWTIGLPAMLITLGTLSGSRIPVFGAGKPAPYNPLRLDRRFNGKRITLRTAELLVAAAGPLSNLFLGLLSVAAFVIFISLGFEFEGPFSAVALAYRFLVVNISLMIFNFIPVPPLDGSKVLISLLPRESARQFERISEQMGYVLLGVLIFWGGSLLARVVGFVVDLLLRPFL